MAEDGSRSAAPDGEDEDPLAAWFDPPKRNPAAPPQSGAGTYGRYGSGEADRTADALSDWFRSEDRVGDPAQDPQATQALPSHQPLRPAPVPAAPAARPAPTPRPAAGSTGSGGGTAGGSGPRRRRSPWRTFKRIVLVLLVTLLAYFGSLAAYAAVNLNKIDALPENSIGNTSGAVYLLVGSDSREGADDLNTGQVEGARTDTIMLLHVPLIGSPTLVSIPRDSLVDIPGNGKGKVNAAFALGGPKLLASTVEQATGLHVDHYVEVGFTGIVHMTDAVGGVRVCIGFDVDDPQSRLEMKKGCHHVDGETALAYVRMRYSDPKGDLGRIERQQKFLAALLSKTLTPSTLLNPFKMFPLVDAATSSVVVDEDTGVVNLARFGYGFALIASGHGDKVTVPVANPAGWYNGESVVIWDDAEAAALFRSLGAR